MTNVGGGVRNINDFNFNRNHEQNQQIKVNPLLAYAGIRIDVEDA